MAKIDIIQHFITSTPGRVPTDGELEIGEWFFNTFDGIMYFKDDANVVRKLQGVQEKTFTISSPGTTSFSILTTATKILSFNLNQLDYCEFVTITPAGSGIIVYDDVAGEYVTEVGDFVKVLYF